MFIYELLSRARGQSDTKEERWCLVRLLRLRDTVAILPPIVWRRSREISGGAGGITSVRHSQLVQFWFFAERGALDLL